MENKNSKNDAIHVAIRVRPISDRERSLGGKQVDAWIVNGNSISQAFDGKPIPGVNYMFDQIFGARENNIKVYNSFARDIILSCMDGMNGTIFAYGQTSSGKTHTMQGNAREPGVIPLAIMDIFKYIQQTPEREFLLRVSYMEIYNENVRDLLDPYKDNLKIHENSRRDIWVGDLTETVVTSAHAVQELLVKGQRNRHVGETNMNERSSRSHTIFRMVIESRERQNSARESFSGAVKVSCLNLVDLAGSERLSHTGAEGVRLKEGSHINKSLLTLGTVIGKLSEGGDKGHIPYRDSKLTRILQPSLGGNARAAIVCTVTSSPSFCDETHSTLKFASRAKTVTNQPEVNEVVSDEVLIKRYKRELSALKEQLSELKKEKRSDSTGPQPDSSSHKELQKQLDQHVADRQHLSREIERLKTFILTSSSTIPVSTIPGSDSSAAIAADGERVTEGGRKRHRSSRRKTWGPLEVIAMSADEHSDDAKRHHFKRKMSERVLVEHSPTAPVVPLAEAMGAEQWLSASFESLEDFEKQKAQHARQVLSDPKSEGPLQHMLPVIIQLREELLRLKLRQQFVADEQLAELENVAEQRLRQIEELGREKAAVQASLLGQIDEYAPQLELLQLQVKEYEARLEESRSLERENKRLVQLVEKNATSSRLQIDEGAQMIAQLQAAIAELSNSAQAASIEVCVLKEKNAGLEAQLATASAELQSESVQQLQATSDSLSASVTELQGENAVLLSKVTSLSDVSDHLQSRNTLLQDQLDLALSELASARLAGGSSALQKLHYDCKQLFDLRAVLEDDFGQFREKFTSDSALIKQHLSVAFHETQELRGTCDSLKSDKALLETSVASFTVSNSELKESLDTAKHELETVSAVNIKLSEQLQLLETDIDCKENVLVGMKKSLEAKADNENQLTIERDTLAVKVNDLTTQVNDLTMQLNDSTMLRNESQSKLEQIIKNKNQELLQLKQQLDTLDETNSKLSERLQVLESDIDCKNETVADFSKALKAKDQTEHELMNERDTLTAQIDTLMVQIDTLKVQIKDLTAEKDKDKSRLEHIIKNKDQELLHLSESLSSQTKEKTELEKQVFALKESVRANVDEIEALNAKNETLVRSVQAKDMDISSLNDRISELNSTINDSKEALANELELKEKELARLLEADAENQAAASQLSLQTIELAAARSELKETARQLSESSSLLSRVSLENESLNRKVHELSETHGALEAAMSAAVSAADKEKEQLVHEHEADRERLVASFADEKEQLVRAHQADHEAFEQALSAQFEGKSKELIAVACAELQTRVDSLNDALSLKAEQCTQLEEGLELLKTEYTKQFDSLADKEAELGQLKVQSESELGALQQLVDKLQKERDEAALAAKDAEDVFSNMQKELEQLRLANAETRDTHQSELVRVKHELVSRFELAEERNSLLEADNKRLAQQIESVEDECRKLTAKLYRTEETLEHELKISALQKGTIDQEKQSFSEQRALLESKAAEAAAETAKVAADYAAAKAQIETLQRDLERARMLEQLASEPNSESETQKAAFAAQIASLKQQLEVANSTSAMRQKMNDTLRRDYAALKTAHDQLEQQVASLQKTRTVSAAQSRLRALLDKPMENNTGVTGQPAQRQTVPKRAAALYSSSGFSKVATGANTTAVSKENQPEETAGAESNSATTVVGGNPLLTAQAARRKRNLENGAFKSKQDCKQQ